MQDAVGAQSGGNGSIPSFLLRSVASAVRELGGEGRRARQAVQQAWGQSPLGVRTGRREQLTGGACARPAGCQRPSRLAARIKATVLTTAASAPHAHRQPTCQPVCLTLEPGPDFPHFPSQPLGHIQAQSAQIRQPFNDG